jgi:single-strand DNA-binding protein
MQTITIAGRIGADAEVRRFEDNVAISFSVGVKDKEKGEAVTIWYSVTLWRKKDNVKLADFLKKGTAITIIGKPKVHVWLDTKTGVPQSRIHITVDNLALQGAPMGAMSAPESMTATGSDMSGSDDLPF